MVTTLRHSEHTNTLCGHNAKFPNVMAGGTHGNHFKALSTCDSCCSGENRAHICQCTYTCHDLIFLCSGTWFIYCFVRREKSMNFHRSKNWPPAT